MAIRWADDYAATIEEAWSDNKLVFIDFFSPTCGGCKTMDAVTYSNAGVTKLLRKQFACYRPELAKTTTLAKRFNIRWTPGLVFLDASENLHYMTYGYHPPEEFRALLGIARACADFNRGKFREAAAIFSKVVKEEAGSTFKPEALYWLGVARVKCGDRKSLLKNWNELLDKHPGSIWAKKASFIRA
jgi:thioredoxin-related protein